MDSFSDRILFRSAYYSLLSEEEVWSLYQLYQPDFTLFSYEVEPSLLIRIHNNSNNNNKSSSHTHQGS